jgi:ABC-type multidrug transport system ATPase subunit
MEEGQSHMEGVQPTPSEVIKHTRAKHVVLEWENIDYWVRVKNSKESRFLRPVYQNNRILANVKGRAESGQLLAIMGPTGCGKTSLLNVLAARLPAQGENNIKLDGRVYLDGKLRADSAFRKLSAYVLQDDKLYAHLTVKETLTLAAQFYLPTTMSEEDKQEIVMDVITELGLLKAKDTIIGCVPLY